MKGYELIKEISNGKIKENTQIEVHDLTVLDKVIAIIEYKNGRLNWVEGTFDTSYLVSLNCYFKIIEEQQDIDIQSIEELDLESLDGLDGFTLTAIEEEAYGKVNKLVQAVKQLDKKMEEKNNGIK